MKWREISEIVSREITKIKDEIKQNYNPKLLIDDT